ncbi:MAG: helix-turn-helix domain-containing protein [Bacteroidales bacterium]|nr:helix-turn-helix domain-containing protein [Bacteroidales bacterium]
MKKKPTAQPDIAVISIDDVPQLYSGIKYFDGNIAFADSITTIPNLKDVFKVTFVTIVFCLKGNLSVKLNGVEYAIREREALFVGANTVVSDISHPADFDCKIVVVGNTMTMSFINKSIIEAVMRISANPVVQFTQEEINLMLKYYELALFKIEHPMVNYSRETLMGVLKCFALDLLSSVSKHVTDESNSILRQGDKLFHKFLHLLATNETHERSVQYFADRLFVSAKYLTSICNEKCGSTASDLIAASIVSRIQQLLQYSDKSIKEIATEMNFDNLSFFGKYVKKHLGDSPNNFRKKNAYGK